MFEFKTLNDALISSAKTDKGIWFVSSFTDEEFLSYKQILENAKACLAALQKHGVKPGDELVLQYTSLQKLIEAYWACLLGGIVPIPLEKGEKPDNGMKVLQVWRQLNNPFLATDNEKIYDKLLKHATRFDEELDSLALWHNDIVPRCFNPDDLNATADEAELPDVSEQAIAFIQFSSGSTGSPKGVALTHKNLLVNIRDIIKMSDWEEGDVFCSWKPLSHDFGMIGYNLAAVVAQTNQVRIPTDSYIWSPALWMHAVHKFRAAILGSPNFGFRHFLKLYNRRKKQEWDWDLSCVKAILNGAEPISAKLCNEFMQEMAQYKMHPKAMRPIYGLAEASLIVSSCQFNDGVIEHFVHREFLHIGDKIQPLEASDPAAVSLVDCGVPYPSTEVRITDSQRQPLPEGVVGQVEIRGDNVTSQYYNNPEASARSIDAEGWLNTEDLGFLQNGRLVFANRIKEMIIIGGVNYFPHDIEKAILRVKGDDALNTYIACSIPHPEQEGEQLAVFVYHKRGPEEFAPDVPVVNDIVMENFGIPVDYVVPTKSIPKTTSGKVQRYVLRKRFLEGEFDEDLAATGQPRQLPSNQTQEAESAQDKNTTSNSLADIQQWIHRLVLKEAQLDALDNRASFFDIGLVSMRLIDIQESVESHFNVQLSDTSALDYPSVEGLAKCVYAELHQSDDSAVLEGTVDETDNSTFAQEPVAIVGMACRFPGDANTPDQFWDLLASGKDPITKVSYDRWPGVDSAQALATREGGFISHPELFDPHFFGISPIETEALDPQQRLLLEVTHEAFENAGYSVPALRGSDTGVYIGISITDYLAVGKENGHQTGAYSYTGTMFNTAAGRVAWAFDLKGPCIAIDTACSSSLTAVHTGVKDLQTGSCDLVVAAGVNIMTTPDGHVCFSQMNALSATGRSRSFDDNADGYIRSDGCGAVVLKRLSDAQRDGDNILAIVKGGAVNHNGHSGGLTVPSGIAQEKLIRKAQKNANVTPAHIDFIEAHGSGTKLGDPQEASALARVFGETGKPLLVGAVKSNIGHTEAAAGMAGLQKVVMSLNHAHIPPNLHFHTPNSLINWQDSPVKIVDRLTPINSSNDAPIAGITSLGINGSNAHMIIEAYRQQSEAASLPTHQTEQHLITLSAKSPASLAVTVKQFADADLSHFTLAELARATQFQRADYGSRYATLASSIEQLQTKLSKYASKQLESNPSGLSVNLEAPRVVFVFTGQGSHYLNMADALYRDFPVFRDTLKQCDDAFANRMPSQAKVSILSLIYGDAESQDARAEALKDSANAQAIIFSVEYALAKLWLSFGVKPDLMLGHSIGEYAAACIAGIIGFDDAVRMVVARGQAMKAIAPNGEKTGKMVGILASESTVSELIAEFDKVWIAAVNAPENVTISGDIEQVDSALAKAKKQRIFTEKLDIHHAFHSPMMAGSAEQLNQTLKTVQFNDPEIPVLSTQHGKIITSASDMDQTYWSQHLCQPVQYLSALKTIAETEANALIELGGTATLTGLAAQVIDNGKNLFLPSQRNGRESGLQFIETLAQAWKCGIEIDWEAYHGGRPRPLAGLPNTGFNRSPWWYQPLNNAQSSTQTNTAALACNLSPQLTQPVENLSQPDLSENTLSQPTGEQTYAMTTNTASASYGVDAIKQEVRVMIAQITGVDESELTDDFNLFALGVDSLMLVQLDKRIVARWGTEITLAQFFAELHTPEALAEYVNTNMSNEVRNGLTQELTPEQAAEQAPAASQQVAPMAMPTQAAVQGSPQMPMQTAMQMPAIDANAPASQQIIQQQLQLMQQQLALLGGAGIAPASAPVSSSTAQAPAPAASTPNAAALKTPSLKTQVSSVAKGVNKSRDIVLVEDDLTEQQRDFVKRLSDELIARTPKSKANVQEHRAYFADWISTLNFTMSTKEFTYPLVAERSKGSRFWDIDGNEYIDTAMGYGTCLFGHNPDFIKEPMQAQLEKGIELGPQSAIAGEVAGLVKDLTGCERVAFANTGTEAVMVAIRLARTVTKRKKIVRFVTSFHGSFDGVLADMGENGSQPMTAGVIDSMIEDTIVLQYATEKSLKEIAAQADDIAAVLVEPVQSRKPSLQPKKYLQKLRALTEQNGIALVFDEMVTGFRCHPGGAQHEFDVRADLVTYGKVVGGGMHIGVIAGHAHYMDAIDGGYWQFGDTSGPGAETTFFAGTFCKHPLTMTAAKAVLQRLKDEGPSFQERISAMTTAFVNRLNDYFDEMQVPITMESFASVYRFDSGVAADMPRHSLEMNLFFRLMQLKGIFVWERRTCFFSEAHSQQDADRIFDAVVWATEQLRAGGFSFRKAGAPDPQDPNGGGNGGKKVEVADFSKITPESTQAEMTASAQALASAVSSEEGRMFVLSQMNGGDLAYRITGALTLEGNLDKARLHDAFAQLSVRHPVLRSSYQLQDGQLVRAITPIENFMPSIVEEQRDSLEGAINQDKTPFSVNQAPLWRMRLVQIGSSEEKHVLVFEFHHMVADGMSVSILAEDLINLYQGNALEPVKASYQDFVAWEQRFVGSNTFNEQLNWWKDNLSPLPEPLNLPSDRLRSPTNDFAGASYNLVLNEAQTNKMRTLARELKTTPFMVLYSLFSTLVYKLSRQQDLCIGIPFDRRSNGHFERTVGMFAQTLAIRTHIQPDAGFDQLIKQVTQQCSLAYTHCNTPLEYIVEALDVKRDISRNPLFDVMFIYETGDRRLQHAPELTFSPCQVDIAGASFDLTLEITDQNQQLYCNFIYATRLFDEATIASWANQFIELLSLFSEQPQRPVIDAARLTQDAIDQQLITFNQSQESYNTTPLPTLLKKVAKQNAKHTALKAVDAELTYAQLIEKSEKLAHVLMAKGVTTGQHVAILLPRNSQLIIAMLAVLRTGASYIPLDPEYPAARINYMLDHAKVSIMIADPELVTDPSWEKNAGNTLINPAKIRAVAAKNRSSLPELSDEMLAYVIYTSGSTGKPKGVMINHGAMTSFVTSIAERLNWPKQATTLGLTTVSFDIFVLEVFVTLLRGGTLVLASEAQQQNPSALAEVIAEQNVNVVQITPSRLQLLAHATELTTAFANVERVLIGGEAFPAELLPTLQALPNLQIFNVYGPTEATVWACVKDLTQASQVTLGTPLANANAYVLNEDKQLMPVGSVGELYLAGDCLGVGYLLDQEKTDAAFVANPFDAGKLMYRTGDLAAWNQEGELVYHGRNDHQIKLRGYRIELSEIDSVLNECPEVAQGAVVVRQLSANNPALVAFCIAAGQQQQHQFEASVRQHLRATLPDYMVPGLIISLDELPLTPNGKIDRKQLPEDLSQWQQANDHSESAGEQDTQEDDAIVKAIREVWENLLGHNQISRHVSYFDVGGNSFSLMLMHNEIDKIWQGLIHVTDIFANPTIGALADLVNARLAARQSADYQALTLPADWFDTSANNADNEGQLLVEPGAEFSAQLHHLASANQVSALDIMIGLQGFFLHKRFEQEQIALYLEQTGAGYRPIQLDFSRLNKVEEIFTAVKQQRQNATLFPVPPEADRDFNQDCLFLVRRYGDPTSTQHKRFDFQLIIDDSEQHPVALRVDFNHQRLNQQSVFGLINDYVRLSKAIIAASQEGLTS
ncbi:non-ribosomal peptide synthetase/type I polyketide synthase [Alteromonas sp. a30]|uniref:non-ribosomal peptide synthetase/type I polyketide synthase n=1 Tax=Alteromonas sp. a30 TaxID=2730917 RepID=UPI002282A40F|nr:non-ribosomal peptide synthetase/type I polyketide synthase [Alteromonas sp. a30]MCY7295208.1 amino acid adenylation domain-containing protein [Alteromonas sp. a30]